MTDPRVENLADILVDYSLEIKKNDLFRITAGIEAEPLIKEVYRKALERGAHPFLRLSLPGLSEIYYRHASDEELEYLSEIAMFEVERISASLAIWSELNTRELTSISPDKTSKHHKAQAPLIKRYFERADSREIRWCGTLFPTPSFAQEAEMGTEEFEDFVFSACFADRPEPIAEWKAVHERQEELKGFLDRVSDMHIEGREIDLWIKVKGRYWENCDGKKNMPDGELFTSPVEDSAEGVAYYPYPTLAGGRLVEGVRLEFKEGKVVKASAERGEDYLLKNLDLDEGARFIGELAFGTNPHIQRITKNILFDEKIKGTMHMALGKGFPNLGGKNDSILHWDLLLDMREGRVTADGSVIYENGEFKV
ncbi:MAG: aminopeptidase [candidate division WOR-3 bacterium]